MRPLGIILGLGVACAAALPGYMTSLPPYEDLARAADAVVIAVPVERRELPDPAELPGVKRGTDAIPAIDIRTTFVVSAVLRGQALAVGDSFELQHYRERDPPTGFRSAGPALIDFDIRAPRNYLMFVKQRAEGGFEAVQPVEPGWCIEALSHPVDRPAAQP